MTTTEMIMLRKAMISIDYARKKFAEATENRRKISWDMLLGEFIVYSGVAYESQADSYTRSRLEQTAAQQLARCLYSTRMGWAGQIKVVRLYELKQLMESPVGRIYPRGLDERAICYLNKILETHELGKIYSSKFTHRRQ